MLGFDMAQNTQLWLPLFERLHQAVESGAMSLEAATAELSNAGYCSPDDYEKATWLIYINIKSVTT